MFYLELDDIIYKIQKFGGASSYWDELTRRLPALFPNNSIVRTSGRKLMRLYSPRSSAKVFHSSHFRVSSSKSTKNVTTIHDLIYEKKLSGGRGKLVNLYERKKAVLNADAIVCISESTRRDLYEYYGDLLRSKPVHVIHHGCTRFPVISSNQDSGLKNINSIPAKLSSGNFLIFVGGRSGYKNFELLLNAFAFGNFSSQGLYLVCTGVDFNEHEFMLIKKLKLSGVVISLGFVDKTTLGALYGIARALIYPSMYEGFGLPPLEAMAAGCPVVCADASSLPEVVGDAGLLFNPMSVDELAFSISLVLIESTREKLVLAGLIRSKIFNWDKTASQYANIYKSLATID